MTVVELGKRKKRLQRAARWTRVAVAVVGAGLAILTGWLALTRAGSGVARLSYDLPFLVHRAGTADDIRIVFADRKAGDRLDRGIQADLLDRLNEAGARAVIYDVIFLGPHEADERFAAAIRRFRGVGQDNQLLDPDSPRRRVFLAAGVKKASATLAGDEAAAGASEDPPHDTLRRAADGSGRIDMAHSNLTVRQITAVTSVPTDDGAIPGTLGRPRLMWNAAVALGADLQGELPQHPPRWINYSGPPAASGKLAGSGAIPTCDASEILNGISRLSFKDKIVLIGSKPGVLGDLPGQDLFLTPFHTFAPGELPMMSGVEIHANVLSNLLHREWLTRSAARSDTILVIVTGLIAGVLLALVRPLPGLLIAGIVICGWIAAGIATVHFNRLWFPWAVPAFFQIPVALVWGSAANYYVERFFLRKVTREWDRLRDVFTRYLSPQMLDKLEERDFEVDLGGEVSRVALMFTDLASFSKMSERVRQPKRILETLNDYFERTTGHIFDQDGVIIQFIGDAIFAAWGTPLPDENAPIKAVRAAWKVFQSDKMMVDGDLLHTRFGLHYDDVVAGNVGTTRHMDYALVGDGVNLASRLEGLNNMLGTHIVMSGELRAAIGDEFRTRRVGKFKVKGRVEPVEVHELLGPARQESEPEWLQLYHKAVEALEGDRHADALADFQAVDAMRSPQGDGPSRFHMKQLSSEKPPVGGLVILTEKQ